MEPLTGLSSENHPSPETNQQTPETEDTNPNSSPADLIASSQDLLTEIFLHLPVISLIRFTSASKQWYTLIKSPTFYHLRNPSLDPPSGLFFEGWDCRSKYHYVPLPLPLPLQSGSSVSFNSVNTVTRPPFTTLGFDSGDIKILQSCNGLLLCGNDFQNYYVYNPTTNRFVKLPKHNNYDPETSCYMTLAFDPSISCNYKVVCNHMSKVMIIEVYDSGTGRWNVLNECMDDLMDSDRGVYAHNAIHWMSFPNRLVYLKLDEEVVRYVDVYTPDSTAYGTILDEFLGESRDGMLLVVRCCRFRRLNVYEIKKDYSEWCVKYRVDLEEVIRVYPNIVTRLGLHFIVQSLVIGERDEDSFVVLELPGRLIQYRFLVNDIFQLCDFMNKSHNQGGFFPKTIFQLSDFTPENRRFINGSCFSFIPSLAAV